MHDLWLVKPLNDKGSEKLQLDAGISPLAARLLVSRGIETVEHARAFLRPNFAKELHNPFSMQGMSKAVERIMMAIEKKEKVLVHGDYDADGVTTTTIFIKGLQMLGLEADFFVPNRFKDGYGVNVNNVVEFAKYDLVITGDTGIKAYEAISALTNLHGTDVIVTDHHEPYILPLLEKERLPEGTWLIQNDEEIMALPSCYEVINPKRIDCDYQCKDLSGAGVAFKVMEAVFDSVGHPKRELYELLDVVATGLVPDLVPLMDVNRETFEVRNLVKIGLNIMNNSPKMWVSGIKSLKETKKPRPIKSSDLGFTYGPILNAAGRLYDPTPAAKYLMEEDEASSAELLGYLNEVNLERRELSNNTSSKMVEELKEAAPEEVDYAIVVESPALHVGITGLVAGNILNEYYRTTIALARLENAEGETIYKGSARSIEGISVYDALMEVEKEIGHFVYGGHPQAAGLTLGKEQLVPFKIAFRKACKRQADCYGDDTVFNPRKYYDLEVDLVDVTEEFIFELNQFEPFGTGNEEPVFFSKNVELINLKPIGANGQFLRFDFKQNGHRMSGVIFNKTEKIKASYEKALDEYDKVPCEILFFPQINDYNNRPQLLLKEIRFPDN